MSGRIPNPIKLFHISHIRNLHSILQHRGLHGYSSLHEKAIGYTDIAYGDVQDKRAITVVPVHPGGVLHDYVPFYFAERSPMLLAIRSGSVRQYQDGQPPIIYLATTVERIEELGLPYVFTDGHGIIKYSKFFNQRNDFSNVDWGIMREIYWADTDEDPDRKRRRQAEFLVHKFFPWEAVMFIGTFDEAMKQCVRDMIKDERHQPQVDCRRKWYY